MNINYINPPILHSIFYFLNNYRKNLVLEKKIAIDGIADQNRIYENMRKMASIFFIIIQVIFLAFGSWKRKEKKKKSGITF